MENENTINTAKTGTISSSVKFTPPAPFGKDLKTIETPSTLRIWIGTCLVLPRIIRNPLEAFATHHFKNPIVFYKLFSKRFAIINDPDLIHHIFVEKASSLRLEPVRQKVLKPVLRDGMLTAEGQTWRKARKAAAPVFSPRHVKDFAFGMDQSTRTFIQELAQEQEFNTPTLIAPAMARLTMQVLSNALFSGAISGDSEALLRNTDHFLKHMSSPDPVDFLEAPDWVPRLTKLRGGRAIKNLRTIVRDTIKTRQTTIASGENVPDDFLTLLLRTADNEEKPLSLAEIEDNIITFIAAGHETTARGLAWTLYLLAHDEQALLRAEQEVDALNIDTIPPHEWGEHLPWLTACFEEAMRLFPPAPAILRQTTSDIDFKDYNIPEGTNVFVSPWLLHRHQSLWNNPSVFDPERFYGKERDNIGRFSYLPFGLGPRVCIGSRFAMDEAKIILVHLLRNFRFTYKEQKKPWPVMKITIQPDNNMPMVVTVRNNKQG